MLTNDAFEIVLKIGVEAVAPQRPEGDGWSHIRLDFAVVSEMEVI